MKRLAGALVFLIGPIVLVITALFAIDIAQFAHSLTGRASAEWWASSVLTALLGAFAALGFSWIGVTIWKWTD